jgi:hypothetical protein
VSARRARLEAGTPDAETMERRSTYIGSRASFKPLEDARYPKQFCCMRRMTAISSQCAAPIFILQVSRKGGQNEICFD